MQSLRTLSELITAQLKRDGEVVRVQLHDREAFHDVDAYGILRIARSYKRAGDHRETQALRGLSARCVSCCSVTAAAIRRKCSLVHAPSSGAGTSPARTMGLLL